ncbi:hypothetical protein V2J09_008157 [Rumex salicifolius]
MGESLFGDLPPPSNRPPPPPSPSSDEQQEKKKRSVKFDDRKQPTLSPLPPPPALKSALKRPLKRPKLPQDSSTPADGGSERRIRFKTTTDASETQVIDAMKKIASHINTPSKFSKASKLAIQLIEAKSVKEVNSDYFYAVLEAAMSSNVSCHNTSVRSEYHALFTAAQDATEFLSKKQKNDLSAWTISAIIGNDLLTDDSFVFSKAAGRVKDLISGLPLATEEDDSEEAAALNEVSATEIEQIEDNPDFSSTTSGDINTEESDPFGLDALLSSKAGKDEKSKGKDTVSKISKDEEEAKRSLKLKRKALINCLEIAAKRYKIPWCQTVIDILAKHAFDNVSRFTAKQREAIKKLWASVHEQHVRRKQGKSVSGKLDMNGFEWLQDKYANEKISIRRAVGGNGDRRCQQWLG